MKSKTDYRLYAKELRKNLDMQGLSIRMVKKIRNEDYYVNTKNVMLFYPLSHEINLLDLLSDINKNFYFPKVSGKELLACPYSTQMKKSDLNIMEPCTDPVDPEILDLVIVPALMADCKKYRLGYGGGFYDRFLPCCKNAFKLGVVPKELFVNELPHEEFDVPLDKIIYM